MAPTAALQVPDLELAIVVLGNSGPSANLREWEILEIYEGTEETAAQADQRETEQAHSLSDMAVVVDPELLDRYAGTYDFRTEDGSSEVLTVAREADRVIIEFTTDSEPSTWTPISGTEFMSSVDGPTLGFEVGDTGPATAVMWRGRSSSRVEAFNPTPEELKEFTGTFYSDELNTTWRFEIEHGAWWPPRFAGEGRSHSFRP